MHEHSRRRVPGRRGNVAAETVWIVMTLRCLCAGSLRSRESRVNATRYYTWLAMMLTISATMAVL